MAKKEKENCVITSRNEKKNVQKKKITKEKKSKRENIIDIEKEQLRKYEKYEKKVLRHNLDDEKRKI